MKLIHVKIDEKFKSYKNAFRAFDNDYSGQIGFTELVEGLETMGIILELDSMKKLFNYLDENGDGQINFSEFCRLHYDNHLINKEPVTLKHKIRPLVSYDKIPKENSLHRRSLNGSVTSQSQNNSLQTQAFNFGRIRRKSRKKQPRQRLFSNSPDVKNMVHGRRKISNNPLKDSTEEFHDMRKIMSHSYYKNKIMVIKKKPKKRKCRLKRGVVGKRSMGTINPNKRYIQ